MIDKSEIIAQLPYEKPFLFVDEIISVSNEGIVGTFTFLEDLDFYKGHFPRNPVTPGRGHLMLLEPRLRARLERVALGVRGRVTAQWSGRHSSTRLGESLDFADYRPYQPGDDYRRIDHNLRARLGVVMVRQSNMPPRDMVPA